MDPVKRRVGYATASVILDCIYRNRLSFSGSGSRETSGSELSPTNLRSVPRLRNFLIGRGMCQGPQNRWSLISLGSLPLRA